VLTMGSLFSGIGGLELGLEWAGLGPALWQVEQDKFCRAVLEKHWPAAERFNDVREVGRANLAPVQLICGGFPCQDVSSAGKGAGLAGERSGLWREFARVVGELRPEWVVVENVTSGARRWFDEVVRELGELDYAVLPVPVAASDVGAPHLRRRLFLVAYADRRGELQPKGGQREQRGRAANGAAADALSGGLWEQPRRRCWATGRAATESSNDGAHGNTVDTDRARREGSCAEAHEGRSRLSDGHWRSPQSGMVPLVHGLPGGLSGRRRRARIRALGNAVVPQCSEVVGWVIRELMIERSVA
jgi:DNA (cytosine-5)-methyltransferase 1